jgi:hypothetical protein
MAATIDLSKQASMSSLTFNDMKVLTSPMHVRRIILTFSGTSKKFVREFTADEKYTVIVPPRGSAAHRVTLGSPLLRYTPIGVTYRHGSAYEVALYPPVTPRK